MPGAATRPPGIDVFSRVLYQLSYLAATADPSVSGPSDESCEPDRRPLLGRVDSGEFETCPLILGGAGDLARFPELVICPGWNWWTGHESARRYESSACVYGVDERVDDVDCFVEVDDRHIKAAGHGDVAVAPVRVGRDVRWPGLLATCCEYAPAGVLDGREILSGEGLEELQVDEVPLARVLPAGS